MGSANKNEIKKLSTDLPIESSITIVEPGRDIYTWKMKEWAGVDPDTGSPMWWIVNRDKNGKEISREKTTNYNKATKEYVGKASPKFQGGLTSSLNLYGFDFSFQLNYSLGSKIFGDNLRYDEQTVRPECRTRRAMCMKTVGRSPVMRHWCHVSYLVTNPVQTPPLPVF